MIKSAVTLALDAVNPDRVPISYIQGDTIGNTPDFDANMAVLNTDLLFMKIIDMRYRLGGAPIAVPVTETERIPSWDEVATVQTISRRLDDYVPMVDAGHRLEADRGDAGRARRAADGLLRGGAVDDEADGRRHHAPGPRLLLVLKRLGSTRCEELFGAGRPGPGLPPRPSPGAGNRPGQRDRWKSASGCWRSCGTPRRGRPIRGMKVLVTSTDVHEFAEFLLTSTLAAVGAEVIDFGINRDPEDIVKAVIETDADAVVITTHNGVARSFGRELMSELRGPVAGDRRSSWAGC